LALPPDRFVVASIGSAFYKRCMRLLITGGCGFLGSNFIRHFLEHYRSALVTNVDALTYAGNLANVEDLPAKHPGRYEFFQADIANPEQIDRLFQRHQYFAIIHCAAESHVDRSIDSPQNFIHTNIVGTNQLLEAARTHGVSRFLQISTTKVYGSADPARSFDESDLPSPSSPYAASKAAADMLALTAWKTYGLATVILRPANIYGPCQHPEKLLPHLITRLLDRKPVRLFGDGLNTREWMHVSDVCTAMTAVLLEAPAGALYNLSQLPPISNLELARRVADLTKAPHDLITFAEDRPANDRRSGACSEKIRAELGWQPLLDLDQGLQQTVEWYTTHRAWWEPALHTPARP